MRTRVSPVFPAALMQRWLLFFTTVLAGVVVGLGSFTFVYAEGHSYLRDDPEVCANCHVMQEQMDAWRKGSHEAVATCNDCHTPHGNVVAKTWVKARNGFWHSFYFTTGTFPDPIHIREPNRAVTEGTCRHCHEAVARSMGHASALACTRCHADVGHWTR